VIRRGDLYWLDFGMPRGSEPGFRRPVVVIQNDIANQNALRATIVCILTTSARLARARGNVLLRRGEGGLPEQSVINVSQVATINKNELTDQTFIGALNEDRIQQIAAGLRLFL
jgi:mRNA interferase MazF